MIKDDFSIRRARRDVPATSNLSDVRDNRNCPM
jgi:hypothetical protein